ncbi:MAG: aminopeptidase, partial [Clostridiales bacterium]|nr:aminopeptidase [Clostridiales bacterium]
MAKKKELADVEQLREDLLICRKNGYHKIPDERVKKADAFCEDYKEFLDHSKTEREAVKSAIVRAEKEGFVAFDPKKSYKAGDKVYYNNRGKALILAVIG